jgi:hypothetical protein
MRNSRHFVALISSALLCTVASTAQADHLFCDTQAGPIFCEDFEGYPTGSSTYNGIPETGEGASETWYGGRFEPWDGGTIHQDVVVRYLPGTFPDHHHYARFEDEAGILFNISTTGLSNVVLQFDWRTHLVGVNDRLVVGYFAGPIDFVNDTSEGSPYPNLVHNFLADGPSWTTGGWVELDRLTDPTVWDTETYALPGGEADLWVAFWMDDGEQDYGKIDNVLVTAIPEPSTALLVGLGLVALSARRRR